jgi:hypothetical protein
MEEPDIVLKVYGSIEVKDLPSFVPGDKTKEELTDTTVLEKGTHDVQIGGKLVRIRVLDP